MIKYVIGALVVFLISALWLTLALTIDNATRNWIPVQAEIGESYALRSVTRRRRTSIKTPVRYVVDGVEYAAEVDDFLMEGSGTVYVNPDDPSQVVGYRGPNLQHYGRPLIMTVASGLFLVVLGLIAFSPKDD